MRRPERRTGLLAGILAAFVPATAFAHAPASGMGPFWDGALHVAIGPEHALAMLGLGMLLGRDPGPPRAGSLLPLVPVAVAAGAGVTLAGGSWPGPTLTATLVLVLVGGLLAADLPPRSRAARAALASGIALVQGALVAPAAPLAPLPAIAGSALAALVVTAWGVALASAAPHFRAAIALRVAGSWIAAVGLLVLAAPG